MNPHYPAVAERARHRCEYCLAPEAIFNFPFEVEHILARLHGGTDQLSNLALACRACNLRKGDHNEGWDAETQTMARLFHPRQDVWAEHLRADAATGTMHGLTPVGRATVARLDMNSPIQLAARRQWSLLGLFP